MKAILQLAGRQICILFVVWSCGTHAKPNLAASYVGEWSKECLRKEDTANVYLRIKQLDKQAYIVKMGSYVSVAKAKDGIISGTLPNPYNGTAPYTFELQDDSSAILRIRDQRLLLQKQAIIEGN